MDYFRSKRFLETLEDWETGTVPTGSPSEYLPRMQALLRRLDDPPQRFTSIIVGGTNGKGTVASLLAAVLRAAGKRVGLYTSPHLHTVRERVQVDGEILEKDLWAEAVTALYDRTRRFETEGLGSFTRFEALTGLSAYLFASAQVDYGVFEVGLGGQYDATNAWDSAVAVLTSIELDHVEVLGDTVEQIAEDKLQIGRPGSPLFTTSTQSPRVYEVISRGSRDRDIPLYTVHEDRVEGPLGPVPGAVWEIDMAGRPANYAENARLAMAVGCHLSEAALSEAATREIVEEHHWPGRFEIASRGPIVVLDGAHNPAAARSLVGDLVKLSERWHFVVGTSIGHDSSGILEAVEPVAQTVLLTRSNHPRATPVEALKSAAPSALDGRVSTRPSLGVDALQSDAPLCVLGSLHLVARARELLDLPLERDTFTEDLHRESLHCLEQACGKLGLPIAPASNNGNVVKVTAGGRPLYFMRNKHPFNDYVTAKLAEDKAYQFEMFTQAGLPVPDTVQIFNPLADARFDEYRTHASVDEVVVDIERRLAYPVVVKRNQGSLAQGVFLCEDRKALHDRLKELCENSGFFDNILLIQEFVKGREFRAVASRDEMLLGYEKVLGEDAAADLNPLHGAGGEAVPVADRSILDPMREIARAVSGVLDLGFYAIDLILGDKGFVILEVNPNPICFFYNQCNGRADFTRIYERLIAKFVLQTA